MSDDAEAQRRFNAAMGKLAKGLTDEGLLIEAGWIGLRSMAFDRNAPAAALDQHKASFFAGALRRGTGSAPDGPPARHWRSP
jgi:hypothetical protein